MNPTKVGRRAHAACLCLAALLAADGAGAQTASGRPIKPAPAFSDTELLNAPVSGWWTNGGTLYNQRYSPLAKINRSNVGTLRPKWRISLDGSGNASKYSGQGQPLVYDGVIYIVTGADDVFAVDVESGRILWTYEARLDPRIDVICCGWSSRGVAMGDGKITWASSTASSWRSINAVARSCGAHKPNHGKTASASRPLRCISMASS